MRFNNFDQGSILRLSGDSASENDGNGFLDRTRSSKQFGALTRFNSKYRIAFDFQATRERIASQCSRSSQSPKAQSPNNFPMRCGRRSCNHCAWITGYRIYRRHRNLIAPIKIDRLFFLTLTITTRALLNVAHSELRKSISKFLRRKDIRSAFQGGLLAIHTCNQGRGWHLHVHMIVEGGGISEQEIREIWTDITGSEHQIDFSPVRNTAAVLKYLLSDALKGPKLKTGHEIFDRCMKGKRLIRTFGRWYGKAQARQVNLTDGHTNISTHRTERSAEEFAKSRTCYLISKSFEGADPC